MKTLQFQQQHLDHSTPNNTWVRHLCPNPSCSKGDKTFVVVRDGLNFTGYCHRCHGVARTATKHTPATARKFSSVSNQDVVTAKVSLPKDSTKEIHPEGLIWLYKYGLDAESYDFWYSPAQHRLIIPVYGAEGDLVYYQGRYLGTVDRLHPKYNSVRLKRGNTYYTSLFQSSSTIVVEDVLSALVLEGAGYHATALLYSTINTDLAAYLKKQGYTKVYIWLDEDKYAEGLKGAKLLRGLGVESKTIKTKLDPKCYSIGQTQEIINEIERC